MGCSDPVTEGKLWKHHMMVPSVTRKVAYVISFHNPLAKESHMAKPNVNVMRSIVCPKEEALWRWAW